MNRIEIIEGGPPPPPKNVTSLERDAIQKMRLDQSVKIRPRDDDQPRDLYLRVRNAVQNEQRKTPKRFSIRDLPDNCVQVWRDK